MVYDILCFVGLYWYLQGQKTGECEQAITSGVIDDPTVNSGVFRNDLPTFRKSEIEKHDSPENQIWVSFKVSYCIQYSEIWPMAYFYTNITSFDLHS